MKLFNVTIHRSYPQYPELVKIMITGESIAISLLNYGGTISKLMIADRWGQKKNIVLNYPNESEYIRRRSFIGAAVGRVAGRISQGLWSSDYGIYQLEKNENDSTHLHGGSVGFDTIFWNYQIVEKRDHVQVIFTKVLPDKLGGYPGNLDMSICYTIFESNQLSIEYKGISDQKTIINPTNHSYFNLSGNFSKDIRDHILTLDASNYLPLKKDKTPTGEMLSVNGTSFDFKQGRQLKNTLTSSEDQILQEEGLNHPFILDKARDVDAILFHPESGRAIEIRTTNSAIISYSGNHFSGKPFAKYSGLALETQELPDAVNHPSFGAIVVEANQVFYQKTAFEFFSNYSSN